MRWHLRVMEDIPEDNPDPPAREEVGRAECFGDLRCAARQAALLAEQHKLMVLAFMDGDEDAEGEWLFACQARGDGKFWWSGPSGVVAICEDRHGGWGDEFPLEGGGL